MPLVLRTKCIVVGDPTVGKSALIKSLQSDGTQFPKNYSMTLGVDISVKTISLQDSKDIMEFYLYDSAGKEIYSNFVQTFWTHPGTVIVIYDVTDEQSFDSCAKWLERVKAQKAAVELKLPGVLIANKIDLDKRRVVSEADGRAFAIANELEYFECSAVSHMTIT
jgi:transport family protein 27